MGPGGFSYRDWDERAEPVDGPTARAMAAAARDAGVMLHAGSIVERPADGETGPEGRGLWNTSLVFGPDGGPRQYRKIHRFGFGSGEPKLMDAGEDIVLVDLPGGQGAGRAVHPLRPALPRALPPPARRRRDGLHHPGSLAHGPRAALDPAGPRPCIEDQCIVIACNTAGTHSGTEMGGHSQVVLPTGRRSPWPGRTSRC